MVDVQQPEVMGCGMSKKARAPETNVAALLPCGPVILLGCDPVKSSLSALVYEHAEWQASHWEPDGLG
ncbi:unnamed protein product [Gadus morhua 'NCC']